jgi:hypothetical protein
MAEVYRKASSYQDTGTLTVIVANENSEASLESVDLPTQQPQAGQSFKVTFRTVFERPLFRFDWQNSYLTNRTSSIWFDGRSTYDWDVAPTGSDRFILRKAADFSMEITEKMRASGGTVFTIPSLLIPNLAPYSFADVVRDFKDLSIRREEQINGFTCYVIRGSIKGTPWLLWVDKRDYLLIKVRSYYSIASFHDQIRDPQSNRLIGEEVRHTVSINERVSRTEFRYQPHLKTGDIDNTRGRTKN